MSRVRKLSCDQHGVDRVRVSRGQQLSIPRVRANSSQRPHLVVEVLLVGVVVEVPCEDFVAEGSVVERPISLRVVLKANCLGDFSRHDTAELGLSEDVDPLGLLHSTFVLRVVAPERGSKLAILSARITVVTKSDVGETKTSMHVECLLYGTEVRLRDYRVDQEMVRKIKMQHLWPRRRRVSPPGNVNHG